MWWGKLDDQMQGDLDMWQKIDGYHIVEIERCSELNQSENVTQ